MVLSLEVSYSPLLGTFEPVSCFFLMNQWNKAGQCRKERTLGRIGKKHYGHFINGVLVMKSMHFNIDSDL